MRVWSKSVRFSCRIFVVLSFVFPLFAGSVAFAETNKPNYVDDNSQGITPPVSPIKSTGECGSRHEIVDAVCHPAEEMKAKASCLSYQREGPVSWQPQPDKFLFMSCTYGEVRDNWQGWFKVFQHNVYSVRLGLCL